MARLSNEQLIELCATPYERLTPSQKRSARAYKRKAMDDEALTMEAERLLEEQPQLSVTKAYYAVMKLDQMKKPADTVPAPAEKPVTGPRSEPVASETTEPSNQADDLVTFLADWPTDIVEAKPMASVHWTAVARILKDHPHAGPAVIAGNLTRAQAFELRRRIRSARIKAFAPAKAYRCEITHDDQHKDKYRIIAQYTGKTDA